MCKCGQFPSKKNYVYWDLRDECKIVTKVFTEQRRFLTEKRIVDILDDTDLLTPFRISIDETSLTIIYTYEDAIPVVEYIENKNLELAKHIFKYICEWLIDFYRIIKERKGKQYILGDIHLKNFLYDEKTDSLYGIDFEECRPGRIETDVARLYVFILNYDPALTVRKKELATYICEYLFDSLDLNNDFFLQEVKRETQEMIARRSSRPRL